MQARDILAQRDREFDIRLGVDLGELVDGRRIVALGLTHLTDRTDLHYAFVPAFAQAGWEARYWCWELEVCDDLGTDYEDGNGAYEGVTPGAWSHGSRDIVPRIDPAARRLELSFRPADASWRWSPPDERPRVIEVRLDGPTPSIRRSS